MYLIIMRGCCKEGYTTSLHWERVSFDNNLITNVLCKISINWYLKLKSTQIKITIEQRNSLYEDWWPPTAPGGDGTVFHRFQQLYVLLLNAKRQIITLCDKNKN